METYSFNAYITIEADNYEDAIDLFDHKLKHGNIDRGTVYVADIDDVTVRG